MSLRPQLLARPFAPLLVCALWLPACGQTDDPNTGQGTVTLALTDAASDDLASFCVDIKAVTLTRSLGDDVGVLPEPIRVDLVTLTEVSQILNVASVPIASYTAAEVTFDFTNAEAYLVGSALPATILDGDGNALTGCVTLPINVANSIAATAGRNRVLELDFDLDQSVRADTGANSVFVEPAIVLRVDRTDPKEIIVGGEINSVDTGAGTIAMELQTLTGQRITDIDVTVTGSTVYQVDGTPFTGSGGLAAVAALPAGTWIQLYGAVNLFQAEVAAVYVEAGVGTYNGGSDIIQGHVVQRIGGAGADATLTVLGHSNNAAHTQFLFNTLFTVNTSFSNTTVVRRAGTTPFDTDDMNVGSQVRLFGSLSGTTLDMTSAPSVARLQITRALGFANSAPAAGSLELDLVRIDLRDESAFTWTDGGPTPADPTMFQATTGSLTTGLGIATSTAVELRGFFPAVDDAGDDFTALSASNRDNAPSLLLIADRTGGMNVTPTVAGGELSFAFSGAAVVGELAVIDRGFVGVTPVPTTPALVLERNPILGIYAFRIRQTDQVALFLNYDDFLTALGTALGQGADVYNLGALGNYDSMTNTLTAGLLLVALD